jgi:hypothetical protein
VEGRSAEGTEEEEEEKEEEEGEEERSSPARERLSAGDRKESLFVFLSSNCRPCAMWG